MTEIILRQSRILRFLCGLPMLILVCAAGVGLVVDAENDWLSVPFSVALVAAAAGVIFLFSSRPAFSIYLGWMAVGAFTVVSAIKYKMKGFSLHFYDAVFVVRDPDVLNFLVGSYLYLILPVVLMLLALSAAAVLLFRLDTRTRCSAWIRASICALLLAALPSTFPSEASESHFSYYMQGRHLSAFFVSLLDLPNLVFQPKFEARLASNAPEKPFPDTLDCGDPAALPDLFLVLQESQTNPAYFPQIAGGAGFLARYAPHMGEPHPLSVETFGGGTWISNLSLMTGLSAADFGWRSPYLTVTLENRVRGALPQVLARCGYRTAVLLPLGYRFVNEGPFLSSIGFETVLDMDDIAAPSYHMRDDFYYRAAEAFIARHRKEDGRPLFLEIQTMFPHSPYGERMESAVTVPGEPFAADPGIGEYLRRMALARSDFEAFLDARGSESTKRGAVILEFGDHQSFVTRPYVDELAGEDALGRIGSLAYRTFYAVKTFNHPLKHALPDYPALDIGFVGASLFDAAGLPMSPMMRDLVALRDHCAGLFHDCADRAAVDRHLRRRIDSGLLHLFPEAAPLLPLVALR